MNDVSVTKGVTIGKIRHAAAVLGGVAVVASGFGFWPFEGSKAWQMVCVPNSAVLAWCIVLVCCIWVKRYRAEALEWLPDVSVFAYLAVNVMSMAFASEMGRAGGFVVKLVLMLAGGYAMFNAAIRDQRSLRRFYVFVCIAAVMSIAGCLVTRFGLGWSRFGFHVSAFKYGSYMGTLAVLSGAYMVTSSAFWARVAGFAVVAGALVSSGTLGAAAAIASGMAALMLAARGRRARSWAAGGAAAGAAMCFILSGQPQIRFLLDDIRPAEKDGVNLKQRYVEWQAELNLLEERTMTGTGAGCINDYRSSFYYRLPKLNTLKPFDQNGYLATAAETGVLGLVCFLWVVLRYGRLAVSSLLGAIGSESAQSRRFAAAGLAGLVAICTANMFSSVHYNGVLIAFVMVLALIARSRAVFGGD